MANWIKDLNAVDMQIGKAAESLTKLIQKLEFETLIQFELGGNIPKLPYWVYKKQGVYLFELKIDELHTDVTTWFTNFTTLWKDGKVTWVPGVKQKRIREHPKLSEWMPLYLGKSRDVGGRVFEHIHQVQGKTTFSMKLNARQNLHSKTFRVSWIPLDVKNYDMIAPAVESALRNIKNPVIGKQ